MVGDALSSGDSVYETDDDLELVGAALPFGLKLTESLLAQSPEPSRPAADGVPRVHALLVRLRRLRGRNRRRPGSRSRSRAAGPGAAAVPAGVRVLHARARALVSGADPRTRQRSDTAVSVFKDDRERGPALDLLVGRLARARHLRVATRCGDARPAAGGSRAARSGADRSTRAGTPARCTNSRSCLPRATPGTPGRRADPAATTRARSISRGGKSASVHLAYAEAVSVPLQNGAEFHELIQRALAVDPDANTANRLVNLLAHRRAHWLAARFDD